MLDLQKPEKGFYYHYKHDPSGDIANYAYEVMGIGWHTEIENHGMVVYRPLYESFIYKNGLDYDVRPLDMFMEPVEKESYAGPRFQKITNPETITELKRIRKEMYGE